jgi:putative thioredoxin
VAAPSGAPIGALRGAVDLAPLVARSAQPAAAPAQQQTTPRPPGEAGEALDVVFDAGDADFASVVELSRTVPVLVALVAEWSTPSRELVPVLAIAVRALNGRMALAVVDTDASPQLAAAFQAQSIPTVAAVLAGRPLSLFAGAATAEQLTPLLEQLLELAAQNGVSGSIGDAPVAAEAEVEPEVPLPPHHAEAYEAIDRQDYAEAARHFRLAIAQNPRDAAAVAALAQVELLERLGDVDPATARSAAAEDPKDLAAQLMVADLDVSGGHVDDAFGRLLDVVARTAGDERSAARERLLAYFEIVGTDDPRVMAARRRLTTLLY